MTYPILIRSKQNNGYVATALTLTDIEVEAPTRDLALAQIRQIIYDTLAQGEIVNLDISDPEPIISSDSKDLFGMFKDDPTYPDFLTEVENYRQKRNED